MKYNNKYYITNSLLLVDTYFFVFIEIESIHFIFFSYSSHYNYVQIFYSPPPLLNNDDSLLF